MLRIRGERLWGTLMELAELGGLPGGGCRPLGLTQEDRLARDRFVGWCREAGCSVSIDNAGNTFALRQGLREAPAITTGSHLDTQPAGVRFDGIYGVLAGLEIVQTLNDAVVETEFPLAVVNWTIEEGVRYPGLLGSQAFTGRWTPQELNDLQSIDGKTFGADLETIGYGGGPILRFPMRPYFELHIEQGPILEQKGDLIGIVTHVQGLRWLEVTVRGANRHAGTTPMDTRSDALVAAAEITGGGVPAVRHVPARSLLRSEGKMHQMHASLSAD